MNGGSRRDARRKVTRNVAGAVLFLAGAWTVALLITGGFDLTLGGVAIRTHDPVRPAVLAAIAAVLWSLAGGLRDTWPVWSAGSVRLRAADIAIVLTVAMTIAGLHYSATVGGGSDSYGYVSQADLWLEGHLRTPQPFAASVPWPESRWTFSPLGYVPEEGGHDLVPRYSSGLPMLMALAKALMGQPGVFVVVPVSGGLLVLFTYLLARRLGFERTGVLAALLVATSPAVLFMHMSVMSDVPVAAAWAIALWCMLGRTTRAAAGCGLASAIALLIRPNLAPQAAVCGVWYLWRVLRAAPDERRARLWQTVVFGLTIAPGIAAIAWLNWALHGSPLMSGYGPLSEMFDRANVWPNLKLYGGWLWESQTAAAFIGMAALAVPAKSLWGGANRPAVAAFLAFVLLMWWQYCSYSVFDAWWYLRFLLPIWPFMMIGAARLVDAAGGRWPPAVRLAAVILVGALAVRGVVYARQHYTFTMRAGEWKYAAVGRAIRQRTDRNSLIFSMQHSGTIRYYGGRMTLTYTALDGEWLDRAIAWCLSHNIRPYAALEDWEVPRFRKSFATQTAGALNWAPRFVYHGPSTVFFYDLAPGTPAADPENIVETYAELSYARPMPPPRLEIR